MSTADGVALEAGRELDERIARALGLALEVPCGRYHRTDDAEYDSRDGWSGWCYTCGVSICEVAPVARPYSTDRAAAFEVVDRLTSAGLDLTLEVGAIDCTVRVDDYCVTDTADAWLATAAADGPPSTALPLCICRAALAPEVIDFLARCARGESPEVKP